MTKNIPIFIINLKKDIDKKKHMEVLCKQYNLQCHFTEAVLGKELSEEALSKIYNKGKRLGRELIKGEIGCALSHINIYKHMVEQNIEKAVVFEDDIRIEGDLHSIITAIDKLPDDWELLLLGYHSGPERDRSIKASLRPRRKITDDYTVVRLIETAKGAHGYLINLRGAKRLMKQLSLIQKPIDHYTGSDKYVNLYAIFPRLIRVDNTFSQQSNLDFERQQITNKHQSNRYNNHKFNREILRPFKQLWKQITTFQKQLKKPKKYNS